jgi:hypothetical protein
MVKLLKRILRAFFNKKKDEDRLGLPIYDPKKYDSLYNKTGACKKHSWYFFYSQIDFRNTQLHDIGLAKSSNRICEKCFLWETKSIEENAEWRFQGFGELAFKKLTEKKIESIL